LARNGCRWPIFARNARITYVRSRQQTGTSADNQNTTSGSTGSEYSTSQVTGSTFLMSSGFRVVVLQVQRQYLWFPSNRKWLPLDWKSFCETGSGFLRPRYSNSDHAECEEVFSFDSVSITFVHIASTHALETRLFGRPLQVTVRPMLRDCCPVCLSVTTVYYGQTLGWIKMRLGTEVGLGPGATVLDGAQLPHGKGHSSRQFFGPL